MSKYNIGDKIKIIQATNGCLGAEGMVGVVTDDVSNNGLYNHEKGFNVRVSDCSVWKIGYESKCAVLEKGRNTITITRHNSSVVATDGTTYGSARCSKEDTFDIYTGAKLALDRFFENQKKKAEKSNEVREVKRFAKPVEYIKIIRDSCCYSDEYEKGDILKVVEFEDDSSNGRAYYKKRPRKYADACEYVVLENYKPADGKPQYFNGKVVCVETNDVCLTVGKVYEFKNGMSKFDNDIDFPNGRGQFTSFDDMCDWLNDGTKFIELVESEDK